MRQILILFIIFCETKSVLSSLQRDMFTKKHTEDVFAYYAMQIAKEQNK